MTNINPINLGISANQLFKKEERDQKLNESQKEHQQANNTKEVAAKDVLGFMAAVNADVVPVKTQKTVQVSNYVNAEQTTRIEDFMKAFEADFDEATAIALEEFPDITQETASNIALAYINQTY